MTTVQYVAATAFSLIVFVMMANFIVFLYARGCSGRRRRGRARRESIRRHDHRMRFARSRRPRRLLAGRLGSDVHVRCETTSEDEMHAIVHVTLHGWLPGLVPDWTFTLDARSVKEHP